MEKLNFEGVSFGHRFGVAGEYQRGNAPPLPRITPISRAIRHREQCSRSVGVLDVNVLLPKGHPYGKDLNLIR